MTLSTASARTIHAGFPCYVCGEVYDLLPDAEACEIKHDDDFDARCEADMDLVDDNDLLLADVDALERDLLLGYF